MPAQVSKRNISRHLLTILQIVTVDADKTANVTLVHNQNPIPLLSADKQKENARLLLLCMTKDRPQCVSQHLSLGRAQQYLAHPQRCRSAGGGC